MSSTKIKQAIHSLTPTADQTAEMLAAIQTKQTHTSKGGFTMKRFNLKTTLVATTALTLVVGGAYLMQPTPETQTPAPSGSPMIGVPEVVENTTLPVELLTTHLTHVALQDHRGGQTFTELSDREWLSTLSTALTTANEQSVALTDELFEAIGQAQMNGESLTLRLHLTDQEPVMVRLITSLNLVHFNDAYRSVDETLTQHVLDALSEFGNLTDLNQPVMG